ncbi:MAG: V-type ATP synthase subunit A [Desulfuromonas sp.]|nr:MAG: V-type ATP synthase subunit A [Desulfuromonas sp.]
MKGIITRISGPTISTDIPGLKLYDRVRVGNRELLGEVIRLAPNDAVVQVYEETQGLAVGEPAQSLGAPLSLRLGPGMLGGLFDGLQRSLTELLCEQGPFLQPGTLNSLGPDNIWHFQCERRVGEQVRQGDILGEVEELGFKHLIMAPKSGIIAEIASGDYTDRQVIGRYEDGAEITLYQEWPVREPRPSQEKHPPHEPLITGQRCIDFLFTLARGGTAIFPGGFGTGKTVLEQSLAKCAASDVVIYVGCGERGNEMADMLEEFTHLEDPWTQHPLMRRTVVVVNTSNMPVAAREASIYTAATLGEYFRDMGYNVLLLADSLSRWAEAAREISSALEEMPGEEGYPTYLHSRLAMFMARAGSVTTLGGHQGSLSMVLSISPPGGDFTEPVTQACLRNTGSFLMLDTALAQRRHFPAVHWGQSFSRYATAQQQLGQQVDERWNSHKVLCQQLLQKEEALREVAEIVGKGGLQESDQLIMTTAEMIRQEFLAQNAFTEDAFSSPDETFARIDTILSAYLARLKEIERDSDHQENDHAAD